MPKMDMDAEIRHLHKRITDANEKLGDHETLCAERHAEIAANFARVETKLSVLVWLSGAVIVSVIGAVLTVAMA